MLKRRFAHFVVIDQERIFLYAVRHEIIEQAGRINRAAVGQVTAVREVHPQHGVAGVDRGKVNRQVRLRTGMRLHVRMLGAKQFFGPVASDIFHDIDTFATAVIAFARISLGVFVREHGTHRFHHRLADDVLGSDQLNIVALTLQLQIHGLQHRWILISQIFHLPLSPL
ncbi:hypothetical protein D3C74_229490 [compost metagenome]